MTKMLTLFINGCLCKGVAHKPRCVICLALKVTKLQRSMFNVTKQKSPKFQYEHEMPRVLSLSLIELY